MRLTAIVACSLALVGVGLAGSPPLPHETHVVVAGRAPCGAPDTGRRSGSASTRPAGSSRSTRATGRITRSIRVGRQACRVAVDANAACVALDRPGNSCVWTCGPVAGEPPPVGPGAFDVLRGHGSVWAPSFEAGTVTQLDPRTGRLQRVLRGRRYPTGLAYCGGRVWVGHGRGATWLTSIDPRTLRVRRIPVAATDPAGRRCIGGVVWVATPDSVLRLDPDQGRVLGRLAHRRHARWTSRPGPTASSGSPTSSTRSSTASIRKASRSSTRSRRGPARSRSLARAHDVGHELRRRATCAATRPSRACPAECGAWPPCPTSARSGSSSGTTASSGAGSRCSSGSFLAIPLLVWLSSGGSRPSSSHSCSGSRSSSTARRRETCTTSWRPTCASRRTSGRTSSSPRTRIRGFAVDPGYPVDLEIDPPEQQGRWGGFFRLFLALPALLLAAALGGGVSSGSPSSCVERIGERGRRLLRRGHRRRRRGGGRVPRLVGDRRPRPRAARLSRPGCVRARLRSPGDRLPPPAHAALPELRPEARRGVLGAPGAPCP